MAHVSERCAEISTPRLAKNIILFSLPLMFSNVLQVLFHMADVAVIGKFSGTESLGAVGSTAVSGVSALSAVAPFTGSASILTSAFLVSSQGITKETTAAPLLRSTTEIESASLKTS